jgi:hypothetical protein
VAANAATRRPSTPSATTARLGSVFARASNHALAAAGSSRGTCTFEFTDAHCKSKFRDFAAAPAARSLAVARALLDAGAHVASGLNRYGYSVLHYACEIGVPDVVQLLLGRGAAAEVNLATSDDYSRQSPLHFAVTGASRIGCTYDTSDPDALANMAFAAKQRDVPSVVKALVAAGARVDARDADGQTPLHLVLEQVKPPLADALALLEAGANAIVSPCFAMKRSWLFIPSRDTPRMTALRASKAARCALKSNASCVHPVVSSFG